jgi:hypothetical protein
MAAWTWLIKTPLRPQVTEYSHDYDHLVARLCLPWVYKDPIKGQYCVMFRNKDDLVRRDRLSAVEEAYHVP